MFIIKAQVHRTWIRFRAHLKSLQKESKIVTKSVQCMLVFIKQNS
jgi:hypothetical protein